MKLYFSHFKGERWSFRSLDDEKKGLKKNPMAEYIVTSNTDVFFSNRGRKSRIDDINQISEVIAVENRKLYAEAKKTKRKIHLVGVESPHELINLRPHSAEITLSERDYILPNGKRYYNGVKVQSWAKKWGKDKVQFNYNSFLEAVKMIENDIDKVKKPKGKVKNPFFDPKVVAGLKKDDTVKQTGVLALREKGELVVNQLYCDNCTHKVKCPGYMPDSVCYYNSSFKSLIPKIKSRDIDLINDAILDIISSESERYQFARHVESMTGELSGHATQIGELLYKKLTEYLKIKQPELDSHATYNILNQQVNIAVAVESLENAGLSKQQRESLAGEIDQILKQAKQRRAGGDEVVVIT